MGRHSSEPFLLDKILCRQHFARLSVISVIFCGTVLGRGGGSPSSGGGPDRGQVDRVGLAGGQAGDLVPQLV